MNDANRNETNSQNANKNHTKNSLPGVLFSIAVLFACSYAVWNYNSILEYFKTHLPMGMEKMELVKTIERDSGKSGLDFGNENPLSGKGKKKVFSQGGMLFLCENDKLKGFSPEGAPVWEKTFKSDSPDILSFGKGFIVSDLSVGDVYLIQGDGSITSKVTGLGKIDSIRTSDNQIGVLLEKSNEAMILDDSLKSISKIKLPIGNMTNWGFSASLKLVAMSIVAIQDGEMVSCIHQFDEKGELQGSITIKDAVVYSFNYKKDMLYAVADRGLYAYKMPSCTESWHSDFQRTCVAYDIYLGGEYIIGYAGHDKVDKGYTFESGIVGYDTAGKETVKVGSISGAASNVKRIKGGIVAVADRKAYIVSNKGKVISVHTFESNPLDILRLDDSHVGFVFNGKVEVFKCLV